MRNNILRNKILLDLDKKYFSKKPLEEDFSVT
jgi:hypothetical protein